MTAKHIDHGGYVYEQVTTCGADYEMHYTGITRRDWLAGLAMQGIIVDVSTPTYEVIAKMAYKMADAVIAEGNK